MSANSTWDHLEHLVVVAGHAVHVAHDFAKVEDDASWCLQIFQKGEPRYYVEHIAGGVAQAAANPNALLVFSGGATRAEAGPRTEALSYWLIAEHRGWWGHAGVRERAVLEEHARDSFENLLFGLCRFHECVGRWPLRITAVGWAFKAERFELHRRALRWDSPREFVYDGVNDPEDLEGACRGEASTVRAFTQDPYGVGPLLAKKRAERNSFRRGVPYALSCPEAADLLAHRGPDFFSGPLPWADAAVGLQPALVP